MTDAVKNFARAAAPALSDILKCLPPDRLAKLERQFVAGNRVVLSYAVDADASSSVVLEMVGADGTRTWIAAINGVLPAAGTQGH
ncbi:hypothetical protein [Ottowia sp. VDI28]|uniref:hypothetical protein n=1 Tax=Ottowia sp. VDI28 TaxID=3133968 RepID=UPI003C2C520B